MGQGKMRAIDDKRVWRGAAFTALALAIIMLHTGQAGVRAQVTYATGQDIVPVYEGWSANPDGSFDLVFGYFNRNVEEQLDVPIGPDNHLEPGSADQGQPTHFYPRRNRFVFHVRVPKDFGAKEVVWALTTRGKTEKTYATLKPDYAMDDIVVMNNNGAGGSGGGGNHIEGNKPPTLTVQGDKNRTASVGQSVLLSAISTDDGIPKRRTLLARRAGGEGPAPQVPIGARCCPDSASGLRLSWFVYRGQAAHVVFDPEQLEVWEDYRDGRYSPYSVGWEPPALPADNTWTAHVKFTEPGTYVLRCLASDGGLFKTEEVTFVVTR